MAITVEFPTLGESVIEGKIVKWNVKPGDQVKKYQALVVIQTDKADNDVPSPTDGVVVRLLAEEGAVLPVKAPLLEIEPGAVAGATVAAAPAAPAPPPAAAAPSAPAAVSSSESDGPGQTSPAVRTLAREHNVDLTKVKGTGENGRITRQDVLDFVDRQRSAAPVAAAPAPAPAAPAPVVSSPPPAPAAPRASAPSGGAGAGISPGAFTVPRYVPAPADEIVPFSRRRRIIADHMVYSKHVAPHVMTIAEIDMHKTHKLREAKKTALKAEGVNLTFLSFIAAATVRALRENPVMNSRVLEDAFVKLKRINLGVAVETSQGLVVPVIRDADNFTVRGLARAIEDTAVKARDNKITADDLSGATFTISNPGLKGNFVGAAIISQPNVGILRIGEIVKRPVVVEVDGQDAIAIHPVMFACLSYDHRIVDGVAANNFLYRITEILEAGEFEV